ncbi:hypothetical protein D3C86_1819990 [compost metagenome]
MGPVLAAATADGAETSVPSTGPSFVQAEKSSPAVTTATRLFNTFFLFIIGFWLDCLWIKD